MKKLILSLLVFLPLFASATSMGPVYTCELNNADYIPSQIKLEVYTAGLFGPAPVIQAFYSFPDLSEAGAPALNFISALTSEDPESLVYTGQITNVSYLVDVKLSLKEGELLLKDDLAEPDQKEFLFKGTCSEPTLGL